MSEQAPGGAPGIAVGARVREREWRAERPPREGLVVEYPQPYPELVAVWWDDLRLPNCVPEKVPCDELEVIAPPDRAPERELAPGIVQSDDTCDGKPRIDGTRLRCDAMYAYWRREVAEGHGPGTALRRVAADYHTTPEAVQNAVIWQAAVRYTKERRKAKKAKGGKDGR